MQAHPSALQQAARRPVQSALRLAFWLLGLLLVAATLLPLIPTDDWWIRALDFPRQHMAVLLAAFLATGWLVLPHRRVGALLLMGAALGALCLQLLRIWPYTPAHAVQAPPARECDAGSALSLVVANLRAGSEGPGPFLNAIRRADPDLVFVVEVDHRWVEALRALEASYPHRFLHPRSDFWGLALYSRLELVEPEIRHLLSDYVPSLRTELLLPGGEAAVLHGLHPRPPLPGEGTGQRDAELLLAATAVREEGRPAILAGDLNAVAWSDTTALMQRIGGLLDPRIGRGAFLSFPTWLPVPLRVPIDHVLFTNFRLVSLELLTDVGSDHLPLLARLCLAAADGQAQVGASPEPTEADWRRAREVIRDGREDAARRLPPG